jgi:hypothetical protein
VKKNCCQTLFCSHKFHNTENYFVFELLKKKIWAKFQRIIELLNFMQKLSLSSQKYGFGIPDPGVKKAPDPGSGSTTLVSITIPPPPTGCPSISIFSILSPDHREK